MLLFRFINSQITSLVSGALRGCVAVILTLVANKSAATVLCPSSQTETRNEYSILSNVDVSGITGIEVISITQSIKPVAKTYNSQVKLWFKSFTSPLNHSYNSKLDIYQNYLQKQCYCF